MVEDRKRSRREQLRAWAVRRSARKTGVSPETIRSFSREEVRAHVARSIWKDFKREMLWAVIALFVLLAIGLAMI